MTLHINIIYDNSYKPTSHCRVKNHINVCYSGKLYALSLSLSQKKHESTIDLKWLNRIEMPFCPVFLPWKCPLPNSAWAPCPPALNKVPEIQNWGYKNILICIPEPALEAAMSLFHFELKTLAFSLPLPLEYFNSEAMLFNLVKHLFGEVRGMKDFIEVNILSSCLILLWIDNIIDTNHWTKKSHENWRCVGTEIFQELNNAFLSLFSLTDNNVSWTLWDWMMEKMKKTFEKCLSYFKCFTLPFMSVAKMGIMFILLRAMYKPHK